jgi:ketosteroid isomerase-like protein
MNWWMLGLSLVAVSGCAARPSRAIDADARRDIDAGNQAWIDGMKSGNLSAVAATYADDALDCGPDGACEKGRAAIEAHLEARSGALGHADSGSVTSAGSIQQGEFVYEWGQARAAFPQGREVSGRYLTVWRRGPDGRWRIFRNMSIPPDRKP